MCEQARQGAEEVMGARIRFLDKGPPRQVAGIEVLLPTFEPTKSGNEHITARRLDSAKEGEFWVSSCLEDKASWKVLQT